MAGHSIHLKCPPNAAASVDAYCEYKRIVGDDDRGRLFTPEEYEEYKKKMIPQRFKNRLYVSWTNRNGMDCKLVGPETPCFCGHRFKEHETDFSSLPTERPINLPCLSVGCTCPFYHYLPKPGGGELKCACKHPTSSHYNTPPYNCTQCGSCLEFRSDYRCACGMVVARHKTVVESGEERQARGRPLGLSTPYKAMGGLTGFSSLMDGHARLDPSGVGDVVGSQSLSPSTLSSSSFASFSFTHPLLKSLELSAADLRQEGEGELDYYERRYQEKLKQERRGKREGAVKARQERPSNKKDSNNNNNNNNNNHNNNNKNNNNNNKGNNKLEKY